MKQTRSLSVFTWCPKLPDFTLISAQRGAKCESVAHIGSYVILAKF